MSLAAEPITEHPCHSELTIEFGKTAHNRGKRASYTRGIHHEHYRRIQPFCDFSGRTLLADGGGSVEQPHHPFNQGDIRVRTSAGEGAEHRLPPHHPAVKVVASTSGSPDMVGWIKVIGSTFKDCDLKPSFAHRIRLTVSTGLFGQQRIFRAESPLGQRILGALESLSPVTYPRGTKFRPGLAQP